MGYVSAVFDNNRGKSGVYFSSLTPSKTKFLTEGTRFFRKPNAKLPTTASLVLSYSNCDDYCGGLLAAASVRADTHSKTQYMHLLSPHIAEELSGEAGAYEPVSLSYLCYCYPGVIGQIYKML